MKIWADGGKNRRLVRFAFVAEDGTEKMHGFNSDVSHNVAEYLSLKLALEWCPAKSTIFMDSELVVKQMNNEYAVRDDFLRRLHGECFLIKIQKDVRIIWIPREENRAGKLLEKMAYFDKYIESLTYTTVFNIEKWV